MEKQFKVYKSSAGSGKTFTLVKEYLKLCLREESDFYFSHVLAITFTNKATYEMKERILSALQKIAEHDPNNVEDPLIDMLSQELNLTAVELKERCSKIISAIVHNYGDFSISTIDRFSHRLIRTFAKDLGLPINFNVEVDEKRLLEETINRLLSEVGKNKTISNWLFAFAFYQVEEDKSWRIENELFDFARNMLGEQNRYYLEALKKCKSDDFEKLRVELKQANQKFERSIRGFGEKAVSLIEDKSIPLSAFTRGKSGIGNYFNYLEKFDQKKLSPNSYVLKTVEEDKWTSGKCSIADASAIDEIKGELTQCYQEAQSLIEAEMPDYISRAEVLKKVYHLALIQEIENRFEKLKAEEKFIHISDFNKKIAAVVLKEPMPFIYERMGERYQNIMIDEFQDTSVLQFMNLLPLIDEALGKGKMNLIVGDAKQAIYRFRGGEMRQLAEMPNFRAENIEEKELVDMRMQSLEAQYQEEVLAANYRSKGNVVKFNNAFFDFVSNTNIVSEKARAVFQDYHQEVKNDEEAGFVELKFFPKNEKELHLEAVLEKIKACQEDNYELQDIAVLCRTRKDGAEVADYLKANKVSVISSEALLLKNSPKVNFVRAFAEWIFNQDDQKAQKDILKFIAEQEQVEPTLLFSKRFEGGISILTVFAEMGISINPETLRMKPAHAFFEHIIRNFNLDEDYDPYIQFWQEEVLTFSRQNGDSVIEFLEYWQEYEEKLALDIPEGSQAVNILTIHKSKGLEFPVVIMPFVNQKVSVQGDMWVNLPDKYSADIPFALVNFNKSLADSTLSEDYYQEYQRRESDLLHDNYVAFTRAVDRLYIQSEELSKVSTSVGVADLLHAFSASGFLVVDPEDESRFCKGTEKRRAKKEVVEEAQSLSPSYHSSTWESKVKLSLESKNEWEVESESNQRSYGNLIHEILAKVESRTDLSKVLEEYHLKGAISHEEVNDLSQKLKALLQDQAIAELFGENVKTKREANLVTAEGELLRPDRVSFLKDRIVVLDYKTGEENQSYFKQLKRYQNEISKTTNLPVEAYILYTELEKVVEVA